MPLVDASSFAPSTTTAPPFPLLHFSFFFLEDAVNSCLINLAGDLRGGGVAKPSGGGEVSIASSMLASREASLVKFGFLLSSVARRSHRQFRFQFGCSQRAESVAVVPRLGRRKARTFHATRARKKKAQQTFFSFQREREGQVKKSARGARRFIRRPLFLFATSLPFSLSLSFSLILFPSLSLRAHAKGD